MFRQQKIILQALPNLRPLLARYAWQAEPANWLTLAQAQAQKFVVPVPLVVTCQEFVGLDA